MTNIADVVANPTDNLGTDLPDVPDATDSDDAVVDVVGPAVTSSRPRATRRTARSSTSLPATT